MIGRSRKSMRLHYPAAYSQPFIHENQLFLPCHNHCCQNVGCLKSNVDKGNRSAMHPQSNSRFTGTWQSGYVPSKKRANTLLAIGRKGSNVAPMNSSVREVPSRCSSCWMRNLPMVDHSTQVLLMLIVIDDMDGANGHKRVARSLRVYG